MDSDPRPSKSPGPWRNRSPRHWWAAPFSLAATALLAAAPVVDLPADPPATRSAELQVYDDLASVFALFRTISEDASQDQFEFLTRWPSLDDTEKRAKYSEFACHELHVFLHEKDPEFFAAVVRPYLANMSQSELFAVMTGGCASFEEGYSLAS